ncbi:hypothetical protein [Streptomyces sp. NPDC057253]|uniref:hypothetical protein n=1 Tax=Streptomyces sp. NPDC057253 TaxID=3346069 RepID=UPI00364141DA
MSLPPSEASTGFDHVVARFHAAESGAECRYGFCDLGKETGVVEELLLRAGAGEFAGLGTSSGPVLGDDGVGAVGEA